jgi:hypothetical protein
LNRFLCLEVISKEKNKKETLEYSYNNKNIDPSFNLPFQVSGRPEAVPKKKMIKEH